MLLKGKSTEKRYRKLAYSSIKHLEKEILSVLFLYFYTILKRELSRNTFIRKRKKKQRAIKEEVKSNRTKHKDSILNLKNDSEKKCTLHHSLPYFVAIGF